MSEAEKPAACPWCGAMPELEFERAARNRVMCMARNCEATGPFARTDEAAIAAWNRVAQETPDAR